MRTYDLGRILAATKQYAEEIEGFNPPEWIDDQRNIALTNDNRDVALFEFMKDGVLVGHYFFHSRGREAIQAAKAFLSEIFSEEYETKIIVGLTPLLNKKAKWMNRHLGFKFQGVVTTSVEPCEIVTMTKSDYLETLEETK